MDTQTAVATAVRERGYQSKHATGATVRIYLKMLEEVLELGQIIPFSLDIGADIDTLLPKVKRQFDFVARDWDYNPTITGSMRRDIARELADVQVTVFAMADEMYRLTGVPYDVVEKAREKAINDIGRKTGGR